jgi:hypothetical protein
MLRSGEIVFISELQYPDSVGRYVRVTGFITNLQPASKCLTLHHNDATIFVDTSLVGMASLEVDELYQFVGEIKEYGTLASPVSEKSNFSNYLCLKLKHSVYFSPQNFPGCSDGMYLAAMIMRCVEGQDMTLYQQAVQLRRSFLAQHATE